MEFTNSEKSKHGTSAQSALLSLVILNKKKHYIKDYILNYRVGNPGFKSKHQFYAPFLIRFPNNDEWILFSTTSMRSDRIKGNQWDAFNLKQINPNIQKAFLVYSDGAPKTELLKFRQQNERYITNYEYSELDGVISQTELNNLIEEKNLISLNQGQKKDRQGQNFEKWITDILSNPDNFKKWKLDDKVITGLHYPVFKKILDSFKVSAKNIIKIDATCDKKTIGKLPSGGNPKTDILITLEVNNNNKILRTISCKRTSAKEVSVHEYKADTFSQVLAPYDTKLKSLLYGFQRNPSFKAFGKENTELLTKAIAPYSTALTKWVLAGIGGAGDPQKQWATHILVYNNNTDTTSIHSVDEYISLLEKEPPRHFGTHFSWTYPSGKRGSSIQLKCKIIE